MAAHTQDPTEPIRETAAAFPAVAKGTSCNQASFKTDKGAFLFVGPGPKGRGFKAMFRLDRSMPRAKQLATSHPDRFEVGSTGWVTTRFTVEKPLPKSIWAKWLEESYGMASGSGARAKGSAANRKANRSTAASKPARTKKAARRS